MDSGLSSSSSPLNLESEFHNLHHHEFINPAWRRASYPSSSADNEWMSNSHCDILSTATNDCAGKATIGQHKGMRRGRGVVVISSPKDDSTNKSRQFDSDRKVWSRQHRLCPWNWTMRMMTTKTSILVTYFTLFLLITSSMTKASPLDRASRSVEGGGSIITSPSNRGSVISTHRPSAAIAALAAAAAQGPTSSQSSSSLSLQERGPSLSIVGPLEVLRQNMVVEIMRIKQRHRHKQQIQLNRELLDRIG